MACRLFGAKPLPKPMLVYCKLASWEQISLKFESEFYHFQSKKKIIRKCLLLKWRPFCPGRDELNLPLFWVKWWKMCMSILVIRIDYRYLLKYHYDVIKWKHSPRYWPFVRGIPRSPLNSPHKANGAELWCFLRSTPCLNGWVNIDDVGDLRRHGAHYDVIVMCMSMQNYISQTFLFVWFYFYLI